MMKKGFTLAEMIATLGIIGVLAVILMPMLSGVQPNEEMLKFKKAYYIAERVIAELVNDEDLYPDSDVAGAPQFFGNTEAVNYKNEVRQGNTKFCELFATKINKSSEVDCTEKTFADGTAPSGSVNTSDSMVWILPITNFADANTAEEIQIDVNGNKAPNCFYNATTCARPDRFTIKVFQDGRVMVDGQMEIEYLNRTKISKDARNETF